MRRIITCGCADTSQFARDAFRVLFRGEDIPEVIEKPDPETLERLNNYVEMIYGKTINFDESYALLVDFPEYNGSVYGKVYDLRKGYEL